MHLIVTIIFLFQQIFLPLVFVEPSLISKLRVHEEQKREVIIYDDALSIVAEAHACDMKENSYFSHVDLSGNGPNMRARLAGIPIPDWYGQTKEANQIESIATAKDYKQALELWLDSPGHRVHLLGEHPFYAAQDIVGYGQCGNYFVFLSYERTE